MKQEKLSTLHVWRHYDVGNQAYFSWLDRFCDFVTCCCLFLYKLLLVLESNYLFVTRPLTKQSFKCKSFKEINVSEQESFLNLGSKGHFCVFQVNYSETKDLLIWRAFSNGSVFGDRFRRCSVDDSRIQSKTAPFLFENGLVWTGPQCKECNSSANYTS